MERTCFISKMAAPPPAYHRRDLRHDSERDGVRAFAANVDSNRGEDAARPLYRRPLRVLKSASILLGAPRGPRTPMYAAPPSRSAPT